MIYIIYKEQRDFMIAPFLRQQGKGKSGKVVKSKQLLRKEEENWMTHIAPPSAYSSSDQTRLGSQGHQHQLVIVYQIRLVC